MQNSNNARANEKFNPISFLVDLGKPVSQLKIQGAGGLVSSFTHSGSYVFMNITDPVTRKGVVSGWITHGKRAGGLYSTIRNNCIEIKAQFNDAGFRQLNRKNCSGGTLVIGCFEDAPLLVKDLLASHWQKDIVLKNGLRTLLTANGMTGKTAAQE